MNIEELVKTENNSKILKYIQSIPKEDIRWNQTEPSVENILHLCVKHDKIDLFKLCIGTYSTTEVHTMIFAKSHINYPSYIIAILFKDYAEYIEWLYTTYQPSMFLEQIIKLMPTYLSVNITQYICQTLYSNRGIPIFSLVLNEVIRKGHFPMVQTIFPFIDLDLQDFHSLMITLLSAPYVCTDTLTFLVKNGCLRESTENNEYVYFKTLLSADRVDLFNYLVSNGLRLQVDFLVECINRENKEWFSLLFHVLKQDIVKSDEHKLTLFHAIHQGKYHFLKDYVIELFDNNVGSFIKWSKSKGVWGPFVYYLSKWSHKVDLSDTLDDAIWWRTFWFTLDEECGENRDNFVFKEKIRAKREEIQMYKQYTKSRWDCLPNDVVEYCVNIYY